MLRFLLSPHIRNRRNPFSPWGWAVIAVTLAMAGVGVAWLIPTIGKLVVDQIAGTP